MNKCYLQRWETSIRGKGVYPGGCSIHFDVEDHESYLDGIYNKRDDVVPDEYELSSGKLIDCYISDELFECVVTAGSIYINETGLNNMIDMCLISFGY